MECSDFQKLSAETFATLFSIRVTCEWIKVTIGAAFCRASSAAAAAGVELFVIAVMYEINFNPRAQAAIYIHLRRIQRSQRKKSAAWVIISAAVSPFRLSPPSPAYFSLLAAHGRLLQKWLPIIGFRWARVCHLSGVTISSAGFIGATGRSNSWRGGWMVTWAAVAVKTCSWTY